jgi:PAT family beta-lactamase induction signal transducer AmpG
MDLTAKFGPNQCIWPVFPVASGQKRLMPPKNLLKSSNGRLAAFGLLYISEGIPYGFSTTAMVAFMRTEGLTLEQIGGFVAALFIPWSFKWIWAPVIDVVKLNRFGGRKAWILFCTTMMIVTLLITAAVDFVEHFQWLLIAIVLNNFFCATQDVAIDALAVSTLKEDERGRGNGFMFGGQYLGIGLGGGGAIFVFGLWGFNAALMYVSAMLALELLFVIFFIEDPDAKREGADASGASFQAIASTLKSFVIEVYQSFAFSGRGPKLGLLFSVLPVSSFALAYATMGTITVDYGLNEIQLAGINVYNTIAAGTGCVVGGLLADRFGLRRMLFIFYILVIFPTVFLALQISSVGLQAVPIGMFYSSIIIHGFLYGLCFGQHAAIFMGMTNPAVAATQFTAFMGMTNLAISYSNYWQGVVGERFDYATVLYFDALIALIPLAMIPFLRSREEEMAADPALKQSLAEL